MGEIQIGTLTGKKLREWVRAMTGATDEQIKMALDRISVEYLGSPISALDINRMNWHARFLVPPDHRVIALADLEVMRAYFRGLKDMGEIEDEERWLLGRLDALIDGGS
jgi:hypothetical protein